MRNFFFLPGEGDALERPDDPLATVPTDIERDDYAAPPGRSTIHMLHGTRARRFLSAIIIVFFVFTARTGYLQIGHGDEYAARAERNRTRVSIDRAVRGLIVDRHGRALVRNVPEFIITITPSALPTTERGRAELFARLAALTGREALALIEAFRTLSADPLLADQAQSLLSGLDSTAALRVMVAERELPGVRVAVQQARSYPRSFVARDGTTLPMPASIAHVIGYLGSIGPDEWRERSVDGYQLSDVVGKSGIEQSYDRQLHGTHGRTYTEITALGTSMGVVRSDPSIPGETLTLSIDLELQSILEEELVREIVALPERERTGAVGIALDPRTGALRAAVSLPAYDPNVFATTLGMNQASALFADPAQPLFFRAISGRYPSGSTIKPLFALAALEEGVIDAQTSFLSTGGIEVGESFFPDWLPGGHGATNVRYALAQSVNTFFYVIGGGYGDFRGLGVERMAQWLAAFRIDQTLAVDITGAASGLVPTPEWKEREKGEQWYLGNTYHLAIGQGDLLVTPLHIAAMTAFFANGGTLWQSFAVERPPVALPLVIADTGNVATVRSGMRLAVTDGSARRLLRLPVTSAGKTGTAQWSNTHPPHAWFTGFAPYEQPELTITILIEEGGEGSKTASAVVERVLRRYFAR